VTTAWVTRVLVAAICLHLLVGLVAFINAPNPAGDFDRYFEIAGSVGRPYVDDHVEHPIGTWFVFKALRSVAGGRAAFARALVTLNACADAVIVLLLFRAWSPAAAAYYAVVSAPVSSLLFNRIDFWSMAAATLAVAAWRERRSYVSAGAVAAGASLKLWPLVFATGLLPSRHRSGQRGAAILFVLGAGASAAVALRAVGQHAVVDVLTFRGATGWQIESVVGSVLHLIGWGPIRLESGSWRIGTINGVTSIALFAAAAPVCLWSTWRGFRARTPGTGWLAAVATLLSLSALFSAQFIGWLVPGGALAWNEGCHRRAVLTACAVFITQAFWLVYDDVIVGARYALALVVVRNIVVIALAIDATTALAPAEAPPSRLEADLQPQLPPV
jgi:hypothetical protein